MSLSATRRDSMQSEADRHASLGNTAQAAEIQAQIDFRNQFPLELGWGADDYTASPPPISVARGELYPTLAIAQAMQKWLMCEQGKLAACTRGAPPPDGVLRPGELLAGAGGTAAAEGAPPPQTGVVVPGTATPVPTNGAAWGVRTLPWWTWGAAVGVGALVLWFATQRRMAA